MKQHKKPTVVVLLVLVSAVSCTRTQEQPSQETPLQTTEQVQQTAEQPNKPDQNTMVAPEQIIKPEPAVEAVEAVQKMSNRPGHLVMLSPQGRKLDQPLVEELANHDRILLLCGRYEGFDQRVSDILQPDEVSVGDFILNGGEVAAMMIIDTTIRLVPGVLGDENSSRFDSFSANELSSDRRLEHAQYTRPREYRGLEVPEVLLSGDHQAIARWREQDSLKRTQQRRARLRQASRAMPGLKPAEVGFVRHAVRRIRPRRSFAPTAA